MYELILRWRDDAKVHDANADSTLATRDSLYGHHYRKLSKEQRRAFDRLTLESERFRAKAESVRSCLGQLEAAFTTRA